MQLGQFLLNASVIKLRLYIKLKIQNISDLQRSLPVLISIKLKLAVNCGDPSLNLTLSNKEYVSGSPPQTGYMSGSIVKCQLGLIFQDGQLTKNISCMNNARWTTTDSCIGKFFPNNSSLTINIRLTKLIYCGGEFYKSCELWRPAIKYNCGQSRISYWIPSRVNIIFSIHYN